MCVDNENLTFSLFRSLKKKKRKKNSYFPALGKSYRPVINKSGGGVGGLVTKVCLTLATPWTAACQAPLSMGFLRHEYRSGLPCPSPGYLPDPGI